MIQRFHWNIRLLITTEIYVMSKPVKILLNIFIFSSLFLTQFTSIVFAQLEESEPMRIREVESIFINVLIAIWALSIPYFMFVIGSIGAKWMLSFGDEQKLAAIKTRAGNVVLSFAMVFGGFLVVKLIISLLGVKDPNDCFQTPLGGNPIFQVFFPSACDPDNL